LIIPLFIERPRAKKDKQQYSHRMILTGKNLSIKMLKRELLLGRYLHPMHGIISNMASLKR
jgi:hypothetical protein